MIVTRFAFIGDVVVAVSTVLVATVLVPKTSGMISGVEVATEGVDVAVVVALTVLVA